MSTPTDYERVVRDLLAAQLAASLGSDACEVHHNVLMDGMSGHKHQIDIQAKITLAGVHLLIVVECKMLSRKVTIDDVLEFASRIEDIAAHKGVIVSTIGFQEGAAKISRSRGIALVRVGRLGPKGEEISWAPILRCPGPSRSESTWAWLRGDGEQRDLHVERRVERLDLGDTTTCVFGSTGIFYKRDDGSPFFGYELQIDAASVILDRDGLLSLVALWHAAS